MEPFELENIWSLLFARVIFILCSVFKYLPLCLFNRKYWVTNLKKFLHLWNGELQYLTRTFSFIYWNVTETGWFDCVNCVHHGAGRSLGIFSDQFRCICSLQLWVFTVISVPTHLSVNTHKPWQEYQECLRCCSPTSFGPNPQIFLLLPPQDKHFQLVSQTEQMGLRACVLLWFPLFSSHTN